MWYERIFELGVYVLFIVLIIYLSYFSTKFIAKAYGAIGSGRRIRFLEKCNLGMDRAIYLVQIEDEYVYIYSDRRGSQVLKRTNAFNQLEDDVFDLVDDSRDVCDDRANRVDVCTDDRFSDINKSGNGKKGLGSFFDILRSKRDR